MPYRLTTLYTRQGDSGYTYFRDSQLTKDDLFLEAIGTLDELNAHIGFVLAQAITQTDIQQKLTLIQHQLFDLGGELHFPDRVKITAQVITDLEKQIDHWNAQLPPLEDFLLPGGNSASAACQIARTVCRRAERSFVRLHRQTPLTNVDMLGYLNRLSDLLFVIARVLGRTQDIDEKIWQKDRQD